MNYRGSNMMNYASYYFHRPDKHFHILKARRHFHMLKAVHFSSSHRHFHILNAVHFK